MRLDRHTVSHIVVAFTILLCGWLRMPRARAAATERDTVHIRLPDAIKDRKYSAALPLAAAVGSVKCRIIAGRLPAGLAFRDQWLEGQAKEAGEFRFRALAEDEVGESVEATFELHVVLPPAKPLTIPRQDLPECVACSRYRARLAVEGGYPPYRWQIVHGELPKGLALSQTEGVIAGFVRRFVAKATEFRFTIRLEDDLKSSVTRDFSLTLRPNVGIRLLVDKGAFREDALGELPVAVFKRPYHAAIPFRGGFGKLEWEVRGELPKGIQLAEGVLHGMPLETGKWSFTVAVRDAIGQTVEQELVLRVLPPVPQPVKATTKELQPALLGEPYRACLKAIGGIGPYRWQVHDGELPKWASLEGDEIAGTPTHVGAVGESRFSVAVADSAGGKDGPINLLLRVIRNPKFPPPTLTADRLPTGIIGREYEARIPVVGGLPPYSCKLADGELPPGLVLDEAGVLRGKPTSPGRYRFSVMVEDNLGQPLPNAQPHRLNIEVVSPPPPPLEITTQELPPAVVGVPYMASLRAQGGWPPYTWRFAEKQLPPWLSASDGLISGTPPDVTCIGQYTMQVVVVDSRSNEKGPVELRLRVQENPAYPPPRIATELLPMAIVGVPYQARISVDGGMPPFRFEVQSITLPRGVTLDANGVLSGTPDEPGDWAIDVQVSDSLAQRSEPQTIRFSSREVGVRSLQVGRFSSLVVPADQEYLFQFPVAGGVLPYEFSLDGPLPNGLELDKREGVLSGRAQQTGAWDLVLRVTDASPERLEAAHPFKLLVVKPDSATRASPLAWAAAALSTMTLLAVLTYGILRRTARRRPDSSAP